jgi:hypothetical protein
VGLVALAMLSACTNTPPKPFGTPFPINNTQTQG